MTAAAFAKGLLALEGELTPILMQMVKSANTDGLLNDDYNARQFQNELKSYLHSALQVDRDFASEDYQNLNPSGLRSISNAMEFIRNPRKMCNEIADHVQRMVDIIRCQRMNNPNRTLYLNETWDLAERRWSKELREFRKVSKNGEGVVDFDISKIPDVYDNIKYDLEHNPDLCIGNEGQFERFYLCVKNMADIVVPQEYGISEESKICVAQRVCTPLLAKIRNDLHRCVQSPEEGDESLTRLDPRASEGIATPMRHVRTRLYFTSESHIHTLMNLIRYGGLCSSDDKKWQRAMSFLSGVTEFNYMTQVVFMVYEDSRNADSENEKEGTDRFHTEILFSPGLYPCFLTEKERIYESRFNSHNKQQMHQSLNSKATAKAKNSNGKSSADASDKEATDSDAKESETVKFQTETTEVSHARSASGDNESPTKEEMSVAEVEGPRPNESDDDLNDGVNLVVLDEVAGKKFSPSELARTSTRKRHATGDRPSSDGKAADDSAVLRKPDDEAADGVSRMLYGSENASSSDVYGTKRSASQGHQPQPITKSMSDVVCNRRRNMIPDPAYVEPELLASPTMGLEECQATVGSGRGQWAKEIAVKDKSAKSQYSTSAEAASDSDSRPPLTAVFSRNDVIVMKRSESKDHSTAESASAEQTTANRDEEPATLPIAHRSSKSRFPYRFKHHTVNLLTGFRNSPILAATTVIRDDA
ncbi:Histidine phosphatase superfamily [Aphelenchoides avenae]|nr:Histidine phosphatase superfamily [Aphelenchus avenae]